MSEKINKNFTIIQLVIAILGSSLLSSISTGFYQNRQNSNNIASSQYSELLTTTIQELDKSKLKIEKLEEKNARLFELNYLQQNEIKNLRKDFYLLESQSKNIPVAEWTKDLTFRMLSVNNYYEKLFLMPMGLTAEDYVGEMDHKIWGDEIGKEFIKNDRKVIETGKPIRFVTKLPIGIKGDSVNLFIVKFPRRVGTITMGIGGAALIADEWIERYNEYIEKNKK